MTKDEFMRSPFDFKFEVVPLDVHICEMQFHLNKRVKVEGPQEGVPIHRQSIANVWQAMGIP